MNGNVKKGFVRVGSEKCNYMLKRALPNKNTITTA